MQTIGVIGAGQMGTGIAQTIAQNGLKVMLSDRDLTIAQEARDQIGVDEHPQAGSRGQGDPGGLLVAGM